MKGIAKIGIKLFAIFMFIRFIGSLTSYIYTLSSIDVYNNMDTIGPTMILAIVMNLVIAALLWFKAEVFATFIVGRNHEGDVHLVSEVSYDDILVIALKIFGLILILSSLQEAMLTPINVIGLNLLGFDIGSRLKILLSSAVPFLKIAFGFALIFSSWLHRILGVTL